MSQGKVILSSSALQEPGMQIPTDTVIDSIQVSDISDTTKEGLVAAFQNESETLNIAAVQLQLARQKMSSDESTQAEIWIVTAAIRAICDISCLHEDGVLRPNTKRVLN